MKEMRMRFDEIIKYERTIKIAKCDGCPCRTECNNLPKEVYSCEDIYFAYVTLGKRFDLTNKKILKRGNKYIVKGRQGLLIC